MLSPGTPAPPFALASDDGSVVSLDGLRGTRVVLFFYPKDDTPGCTRQACSLRDGYEAFRAAGVEILGVSPDGVESHARWRAKLGLPFRLLSDPDGAMAAAYGVWVEREGGAIGVVRSAFAIDGDGTLLLARVPISPEETVPETLAALGLEA